MQLILRFVSPSAFPSCDFIFHFCQDFIVVESFNLDALTSLQKLTRYHKRRHNTLHWTCFCIEVVISTSIAGICASKWPAIAIALAGHLGLITSDPPLPRLRRVTSVYLQLHIDYFRQPSTAWCIHSASPSLHRVTPDNFLHACIYVYMWDSNARSNDDLEAHIPFFDRTRKQLQNIHAERHLTQTRRELSVCLPLLLLAHPPQVNLIPL